MKPAKFLSLILAIILLLCALPMTVSAALDKGNTGVYDGMLSYKIGRNGTVTITKCAQFTSGAVVIPAEIDGAIVTSIGDYSFQHCVKITSVEIPPTVTEIGYSAFYGCVALEEVNIPDSVTKIEYGAFYNCKALKKADIADLAAWCHTSLDGPYANPSHITGELVVGGKALTAVEIPQYVTKISGYTFYGCDKITSVSIPDGVTEIGECAFYGCQSLGEMNVSAAVTSIGEGAFSECYGLKVINVADGNTRYVNIKGNLVERDTKMLIRGFDEGKIPSDGSVTNIGSYAFAGCKKLKEITIPEAVTFISPSVFENCIELQKATLPNSITFINASMFAGCEKLSEINVPESITRIGVSAFRNCKALKKLDLPDNLEQIDGFAFAYSGLVSFELPKSVKKLGEGAFDGCSKLLALNVEKGNGYYYSKNNCIIKNGGKLIRGCKTSLIPADGSVNEIATYAFSGTDKITAVVITESIKNIGVGAFSGCDALKKVYYGGNDMAFRGIKIANDNEPLKNAELVTGTTVITDGKHYIEEESDKQFEDLIEDNLKGDGEGEGTPGGLKWWIWVIIGAAIVAVVAVVVIIVKRSGSKKEAETKE
ncbi:MAG: leucine-rich repeat domain-containing protein [Clostridia bacterium]|nr:leucine-rich repeat domain-containing protein [Clostridia bacterium]